MVSRLGISRLKDGPRTRTRLGRIRRSRRRRLRPLRGEVLGTPVEMLSDPVPAEGSVSVTIRRRSEVGYDGFAADHGLACANQRCHAGW